MQLVRALFVVYHARVAQPLEPAEPVLSTELVFPPYLRAGSRVAVVAPASPFPEDSFAAGVARLRERYDVTISASIREKKGFLAGDDARRRDELAAAMRDREIAAIFCARGGYGVTRIVHDLPWDEFARAPKWLVGFSDITALHLEANARGVASLHAPNVAGLAANADLFDVLEGHARNPGFSGVSCVHGGNPNAPFDEGISFGGNLALVVATAAANRLKVPRGAIFFLEDVTERPYRVDRMLTSLIVGGYFRECAAIVFGGFTECDPGPDGITVDEVLAERTRDLGIPVVSRAPFGHGAVNRAFVLGARCRVERDVVRFFTRA